MKKLVLLTLALALMWTSGAGFGYMRGTSDTLRGTGHLTTNTDGKNVITTDNLAPTATAPFWVSGQKPAVANAIWRFTAEKPSPSVTPAAGTSVTPDSGK